MVDGNEVIQSDQIFQGQVQILGNLTVTQKVNDIVDLAKEVLTLSTGGSLYGIIHLLDYFTLRHLLIDND